MANKFNTIAGGALLLGGAWVVAGKLDQLGCAYPDPRECIEIETPQAPSEIVVGDMELKTEDLVGTTSYNTYGEVAVTVGGEQSKVDWDSSRILDFAGDVDATLYWNRYGDDTMELRYNPCIKKSDDFTQLSSAPISPSIESVGSDQVDTTLRGSLDWEVDFIDTGAAAGTVNTVTINAGILDTCFMRIPETIENQNTFTYHDSNQEALGNSVDATFRYLIRNTIVKFALAQACPEAVVDIEAVKDDLSTVVLGQLIAANPDKAQVLSDAFSQGRFIVDLESPETRRSTYQQDFDSYLSDAREMTESLPDVNGETTAMKKPVFGSFAVRDCAVPVEGFSIVAIETQE